MSSARTTSRHSRDRSLGFGGGKDTEEFDGIPSSHPSIRSSKSGAVEQESAYGTKTDDGQRDRIRARGRTDRSAAAAAAASDAAAAADSSSSSDVDELVESDSEQANPETGRLPSSQAQQTAKAHVRGVGRRPAGGSRALTRTLSSTSRKDGEEEPESTTAGAGLNRTSKPKVSAKTRAGTSGAEEEEMKARRAATAAAEGESEEEEGGQQGTPRGEREVKGATAAAPAVSISVPEHRGSNPFGHGNGSTSSPSMTPSAANAVADVADAAVVDSETKTSRRLLSASPKPSAANVFAPSRSPRPSNGADGAVQEMHGRTATGGPLPYYYPSNSGSGLTRSGVNTKTGRAMIPGQPSMLRAHQQSHQVTLQSQQQQLQPQSQHQHSPRDNVAAQAQRTAKSNSRTSPPAAAAEMVDLTADEVEKFLDLIEKHNLDTSNEDDMARSVTELYQEWLEWCAKRNVASTKSKQGLVAEFVRIHNGAYGRPCQQRAIGIVQGSRNGSMDPVLASATQQIKNEDLHAAARRASPGLGTDGDLPSSSPKLSVGLRSSSVARPFHENGAYPKLPSYSRDDFSPSIRSGQKLPLQNGSNGADLRVSAEAMRLEIREDIWKEAAVMITQLVNEQISDVVSENRELRNKIAQLETHSDNLAQWIQHLKKVQEELISSLRITKTQTSPTFPQQQQLQRGPSLPLPSSQSYQQPTLAGQQRESNRSPHSLEGRSAPPNGGIKYEERLRYEPGVSRYNRDPQSTPATAGGPSISPPYGRQQLPGQGPSSQSQVQPQSPYLVASKTTAGSASTTSRRPPPPPTDPYYDRMESAESRDGKGNGSKSLRGSTGTAPRTYHRDAADKAAFYEEASAQNAQYLPRDRSVPTASALVQRQVSQSSDISSRHSQNPASSSHMQGADGTRMLPMGAYYPPSPFPAPSHAISDESHHPQQHVQYHSQQRAPSPQHGGPPRFSQQLPHLQHHHHHQQQQQPPPQQHYLGGEVGDARIPPTLPPPQPPSSHSRHSPAVGPTLMDKQFSRSTKRQRHDY